MDLIPAIDLIGGKCVRLSQGIMREGKHTVILYKSPNDTGMPESGASIWSTLTGRREMVSSILTFFPASSGERFGRGFRWRDQERGSIETGV